MVTIKHIVGSQERIVQAVSVSYDKKTFVLTGHGVHEKEGDEAHDVTFNDGHAFVMNSDGKTVGVYNMKQ